jgi:predicted nucleic acid-binding protein
MSMSDPRALVDTNVLVYATDTTSAFHESARQLRDRGFRGELPLVITPQVVLEFFAVVTNPRRVANPRSPHEAREEVAKDVQATAIGKIYPREDGMACILGLLADHQEVSRQEIVDLALVATMLSNGVTRLYTYNHHHCSRFPEIEVLAP